MDLLQLFVTVVLTCLYLVGGLLVLLRYESRYPTAMNAVAGTGPAGAIYCWLIWPWTALLVLHWHRRSTPRGAADE